MDELFDVFAVRIDNGTRRLLATGKSEADANAIVKMAVMRRGVDEEFYVSEPHAVAQSELKEQRL